jgi:hypothetical protein
LYVFTEYIIYITQQKRHITQFKMGRPCVVAHICNPSYSGGIDRCISVQGQHGQKINSINKLGMVAHIYNPTFTEGIERKITI